jgi:hypothetical protein
MGRPEDVVRVEESHTGRWLAPLLQRPRQRSVSQRLMVAEAESVSRQLAL